MQPNAMTRSINEESLETSRLYSTVSTGLHPRFQAYEYSLVLPPPQAAAGLKTPTIFLPSGLFLRARSTRRITTPTHL
jgi:hypothetical protein